MKNFVHPGYNVRLIAPAAVLAGAGVLVGSLFGIAAFNAASGAEVEVATKGVFTINKTSAQAWTQGQPIYWNNTAKEATSSGAGNTLIGVAVLDADNPSSTGYVMLIPAWSAPSNLPGSVSFSAAAGSTNVSEVTVTVKDGGGVTLAAVHNLDLWLSDAATGEGLTGTTASGAVAAKASSGTDLATLVSKKALRIQTKATGIYILSITDSAKTGFYPCASIGGKTFVGSQLVTGNYG